jgi:hypothetical protein
MCLMLQRIPDVDTLVPCRNCWQCRETRVNDLVGRCIAESLTATQTIMVTLTYSGDHPHAALLVYPDFQKFIKRLRFAGFKVRYLVCGEYGSKKGRAHWHAILFFSGAVPDFPAFDTRADWPYWSNAAEGRGFVFFQRPNYNGFRYALKYVLKDQKQNVATKHCAMSKRPPLGFKYFMGLADDLVEQCVAPQNGVYQFRNVKNSLGKHRRFILQGRMRELFVDKFLTTFRLHHRRDYPFSDWLSDQEDRYYRDDFTLSIDQWRHLLATRPTPLVAPMPLLPFGTARDVVFPYSSMMALPVLIMVITSHGISKEKAT